MSKNLMKRFWHDDAGAITVDWVVLSAAIAGFGIATTAAVSTGTSDLSDDTSSAMADYEISTSFGSGYTAGDWTSHNPGIVPSYTEWMSGFNDQQLLDHMANMEQYKDMPPNSGHPYDTYHDEYYIAKDEAAGRGLL